MMKLKDDKLFCAEILDSFANKGLSRGLRVQEGPQCRMITVDGKQVLNFCSNNYLGLADDPRLTAAAAASLQEEGFGAGASRLVCGNMPAHQRLEKKLAMFKGAESSLIFSTGYMANVGVISGLFGRDDVIFSDRLNHASIIDGITLSRAEMKRYPHNDMAALERMLKETSGFKKRAIITDSVFSMDGDIAPLDEIVELARRYDCLVMIDEAHAFGVMGSHGKGLAEHFGVQDEVDIQMGTLSKAAGSFGAYVCGSKDLCELLLHKARSFIYTTGLPPSVAAASLAAVEIIEREADRREQLWRNVRRIKDQLAAAGFDTGHSQTPIIPLIVKDALLALEFSKRLFDRGIFVSAIRPPTVPVNTARLRVTVMATHTEDDIERLAEAAGSIGRETGLI